MNEGHRDAAVDALRLVLADCGAWHEKACAAGLFSLRLSNWWARVLDRSCAGGRCLMAALVL